MKEEQKKDEALLANVTKEMPAKGKVLSIGEGRYLTDGSLVKPTLKVGDIVVYNKHMIGHELKGDDGKTTVLISSNAIFGKYII